MNRKIRLENYDYSRQGLYFITFCCKNREPYLSQIDNSKVILSTIGAQLDLIWNELNKHHPHAEAWDYVIMPDHFHGIIHIHTGANTDIQMNQYGKPISGSVSVMVNGIKGAVKRWCNANNHAHFKWQSRFWDTIIRNEQHLWNVQNYIAQNPEKWGDDDGTHPLWEET